MKWRCGPELRATLLYITLYPAVGALALDDALADLTRHDPRKARIVELRYFGGLSVEETAEVIGVHPNTVIRDWALAKAWLARQMNRETEPAAEASDTKSDDGN